MKNEIFIQRARLLMEQHRTEQAADQLRQLLADDPNDAEGHSLLAICLLENRDKWHDATREAEQGVGLAPDNGFSHYVLAAVHQKRNRFPEALQSIETAIQLSPEQSHYYGLQASVYCQQGNWKATLESATTGLSLDPEDDSCSSMRTFALERLGNSRGAIEQADAAVSRNPDSAIAHSARGWALLNSGKYREAQEAFRESLRLSPTNEMARAGMIQSLNSNYIVFRCVFKFYTLVGRMAQGAQWAILFGMFFGMQALRAFANTNPEWEPYVLPITVLYLAFCLLSWIATPLFNTFLRFHSFGKYLLSDKEKWASNLIAILGLVAVSGATIQALRGDFGGAILMFIAPVFLTLPVSMAFQVDSGWPQWTCIAICGVLGLLCLGSLALIVVDGPWPGPLGLYGVGIMLFTFLGNFLGKVTVRQ
ncbi:MAG: tetratricopeptide repeat protein [Pirellulaceae bacterium]|nr:tetratricopeptide repeat protein [Pirellulaceae bacterium]